MLKLNSKETRDGHAPEDLNHVQGEWVAYYNTIRPHAERSRLPPIHAVPDEVPKLDRDQIIVRSYVERLLKSFERNVGYCPSRVVMPLQNKAPSGATGLSRTSCGVRFISLP